MKKRSWLALALAMLMLLSACGGAANTPTEDDKQDAAPAETQEPVVEEIINTMDMGKEEDDGVRETSASGKLYPHITVALESDPGDLLPYNANNSGKLEYYTTIYECLYQQPIGEYEYDYVPVMADGQPEIIDDTHWRVKLCENIYDWEGNHITASDVVFSFEWLISTAKQTQFDLYENVEAIGDYELEFTWTQKPINVGGASSIFGTLIFSEKAFGEHDFGADPVGTGCYKVKEYVPGSKVVLEVNENYWKDKEDVATMGTLSKTYTPNVQTIEYHVISEGAQRAIALTTGDIQYAAGISAQNIGQFQEGGAYADGFNAITLPAATYYRFHYNFSEDSVASDINFRLAIAYAIDNVGVCNLNDGLLPAHAFGSSIAGDYVDSWTTQDSYFNVYDPELAKEYLAKTAYNGEPIVLLTGNSETYKSLAECIQSYLGEVGITMEIQSLEQSLVGTVRKDSTAWDILIMTAGGTELITSYNMSMNAAKSGGITKDFLEDPKLQELYDTAKIEEYHDDAHMDELMQYVIDNCYFYCVATESKNYVMTDDLCTLYRNRGGAIIISGCEFYVED